MTPLRSLNSSTTSGLHDPGTVILKILGFCQCHQNAIFWSLPSLQPHHSSHPTSFAYTLVDALVEAILGKHCLFKKDPIPLC